jgi:hypothetical protein
MTEMKIKLNAAARLLAAEGEAQKDPAEESLKRRLEIQKEKPTEDQSFGDKKSILDTQEQLERTKEQVKRKKEGGKPEGGKE